MEPLYSTYIDTKFGNKTISVYSTDIRAFDEPIDLLVTSSFRSSYGPTPGTVFHALNSIGISVQRLSKKPFIELKTPSHIFITEKVKNSNQSIQRVCCVDLPSDEASNSDNTKIKQTLSSSMRALFNILDIASAHGIDMDTVALPLLGSGNQNISGKLTIVPLLNECISFLNRNNAVKRICFIEKNADRADIISEYLRCSYSILRQDISVAPCNTENKKVRAFISYSSADRNIADNLCSKLEMNGIPTWYAPRNTTSPYAESIIKAIEESTHFIIILSQNSMKSQHVLNEIDIAFQRLPNNIKFMPLRMDDSIFEPSFQYYLSRQHWMDAIIPPLESRLNEFVQKILDNIDF